MACVDQSAQAIQGCGNQRPGTQRVKPSLLTQGGMVAYSLRGIDLECLEVCVTCIYDIWA